MGGVSKSIRSNTKLLSYLTRQEREELEAILLATPEPMTIIYQIVRPDGSTQGYLLHTPEGYVEMAPDDRCWKATLISTTESSISKSPNHLP
jgi:hypothetical protein